MGTVTDFTGKRDVPPAPKKRRSLDWLRQMLVGLGLTILILLSALCWAIGHSEPPTAITQTVPVTVVVTQEVYRVVTVQPEPTLPPIEVTRVVIVYWTVTPAVQREMDNGAPPWTATPPANGKG